MYARFVTIYVEPGKREIATAIGDAADKKYRASKGFVDVHFLFIDEAKGEYGSFSVWETREDADAAGAAHREWVISEHANDMKAPPVAKVWEVYEPK